MEKISPEQRHRCKMVIEKFNLFVNTSLQTVRANRKTHEELAIRRENENKNYKLEISIGDKTETVLIDAKGSIVNN